MEQIRSVKFKKTGMPLVIVSSVAIVLVVVLLCFAYIQNVSVNSREATLDTFTASVYTMKQMARGLLEHEQMACNGWAKYLNQRQPTLEMALEFLRCSNSDPDVMAHLIDPSDMRGVSSVADEYGNAQVDYSRLPDIGLNVKPAAGSDMSISVTDMYTNPVDGMPVVAFGSQVRLTGENGTPVVYDLLRVVHVSAIRRSWMFPLEFENAELALIKNNGDYILRPAVLKSSNFWEYLRIYNDLTYGQRDALAAEMVDSQQVHSFRDASGENAYFVCTSVDTESDWAFVGYLPAASVPSARIEWTMVMIVAVGFVALFLVSGSHILSINRKLKQSVEETRNANMAKTRFLSSMSHDIRTPMNAIIGMTAIASKHIHEPEQVQDCLGKITLASNHLLTLVNDVLDISKVESGKMSLSPVVFSLPESISNLANIVRPQVRAKALNFEIHIQRVEFENLYADELRLNQIFINILSNAVKYTNEGGKITMTVEETKLPDDPKRVELTYVVQDTGIGMSREFQKDMYSAFSRAVDTRIDKIQGTGLGLAITKQMVDLMGGTIECESEPGKGTKFTVTIRMPIAERLENDLILPPMELLVADDDPIFLATAKDTLESMNLKVDAVSSGAEAVERVISRHDSGRDYPAVIIDWKMPGMDGIETTRRIRGAVGREVPIIIISSYDWTEVEQAARAAGADAFINKPLFRSTVYYKMNEIFHFDSDGGSAAENGAERFAGLHLLVAEDNDLNWEIIEELLEMYDITCDRAANGEICVNMMGGSVAGTYDAILMDIQMPIMNGREACCAIRRFHNEGKKNIPIIAMTADAFAEDIKSCMDAGMNGHVSKPVDLNKLFAELDRAGLGGKKVEDMK